MKAALFYPIVALTSILAPLPSPCNAETDTPGSARAVFVEPEEFSMGAGNEVHTWADVSRAGYFTVDLNYDTSNPTTQRVTIPNFATLLSDGMGLLWLYTHGDNTGVSIEAYWDVDLSGEAIRDSQYDTYLSTGEFTSDEITEDESPDGKEACIGITPTFLDNYFLKGSGPSAAPMVCNMSCLGSGYASHWAGARVVLSANAVLTNLELRDASDGLFDHMTNTGITATAQRVLGSALASMNAHLVALGDTATVIAPTVTSVSPSPNSTISVATTVTLTFDAPVHFTSNRELHCYGGDGGLAVGAYSYSSDGRTITLAVEPECETDSKVTVQTAQGLSMAGNVVADVATPGVQGNTSGIPLLTINPIFGNTSSTEFDVPYYAAPPTPGLTVLDACGQGSNPAALASGFHAYPDADSVLVRWSVESEDSTVAWLVERAASLAGPFQVIRRFGATGGQSYSGHVANAPDTMYRLVEVEVHGDSIVRAWDVLGAAFNIDTTAISMAAADSVSSAQLSAYPTDLDHTQPVLPPEWVCYTPAAFAGAVQPLANMWTSLGHPATVVTLETIGGPSHIRSDISNEGGHVRYVLLMGDASDSRVFDWPVQWNADFGWAKPSWPSNRAYDILPVATYEYDTNQFQALGMTRWTPYYPNDWDYADLDGDGWPDIAIGRVPARNASEVTAYVQKIITLTNHRGEASSGLGFWFDEVSSSSVPGSQVANEAISLLASLPPEIVTHQLVIAPPSPPRYEFRQPAAAADLAAGRSIVTLLGANASRYDWVEWLDYTRGFSWSHVSESSGATPFLLGTSCGIANFDETEQQPTYYRPVVESGMLQPSNTGPWGAFGATRGTWQPGDYQLALSFLGQVYQNGTPTVGDAALASMRAVGVQSARFGQLAKSYTLLGDPLACVTDAPRGIHGTLKATSGNRQVVMIWTYDTPAIATVFKVQRSDGPYGPFAELAALQRGPFAVTGTAYGQCTYVDSTASYAKPYYYRVIAGVDTGYVKATPTSGGFAGSVEIPALLQFAPEWRPSGAEAIHLRWGRNNSSAAGYRVFRSEVVPPAWPPRGEYVHFIGSTTDTEFIDSTAAHGQQLYYVVEGYSTQGAAAQSVYTPTAIRVDVTKNHASLVACPQGDADSLKLTIQFLPGWFGGAGTYHRVTAVRRGDSDASVLPWDNVSATNVRGDTLIDPALEPGTGSGKIVTRMLTGCGRLGLDVYVDGVLQLAGMAAQIRSFDLDGLERGAVDSFDQNKVLQDLLSYSPDSHPCDDLDGNGHVANQDYFLLGNHVGHSMPRHVLSPNGGETWTTGQTATVTWQRGYGDSAKVEISATSGTTAIALLAHAAPDTGRLTLSVPGGLDKNCSSCKIQVQHTAGTYDGGSGELVGKDASDNAIALHDGVAPSAVTLNVDEISNQSVALTWLAPGDDGNVGTASGYEVRYSTSPINAGNWTSATVASNPPTPHASGYTEYCWVSSLSANRTYYFALKSKDAVPNWSAMSNCVSAKTLPAGGGGGGSAAPAGPGVWSATPGTRRGVSFAALDSSGTGSIVQWRLAAEEARSPDQVLWRVYWASDSLDSAQIAAVRAVTLQTPDSSGKWLDRADYASRTIPSLAAFVGYLDPLARLLMTGGYVPVAMAARAHSTTDSTHDFVLRDLRSANQGSSVAPDSVMQALTTLTVGDTLTATYARVDSVSLDAQEWWVLVQAPTMTGGRGPAHQVPLTSALPTRFALLQNRPNPFGVATTLRFDLPSPEHVRLQVFDMQGRRVCTLADQSFDAGQWSVDWNARNEAGALARPGVYLYRIEAGRFRSQKKMVLLP